MRKLQHRRLRRALEIYLDGESDPSLAVVVRHHLEECWSCTEDAEWLLLIKAALRRIDDRRPIDLAVARLDWYAASLMTPRRP